MLACIQIRLAGSGGMCWSSRSFPRQCAPCPSLEIIALVAQQLKGVQVSVWTTQCIKTDWIYFWLIDRAVDKGSLRAFQLPLLLKWHPLRARLCKQVWLVVISAPAIQFTSDYGCDSLSAFPAFLDTLLSSGFESWHSHLFMSNWLFREAQKSPFPLAFVVTSQESEVQLNGLARSADCWYGNWLLCFETFQTCPWPQRGAAVFPSSVFFCFTLICFFLSCSDIWRRDVS